MSELHSVLRRQLRRVGIDDPSELPDEAAWTQLLERVSDSYDNADDDRYRLERSLDISSQEMEELHTQLRAEHDKLHAVLAALTDGICYLDSQWRIQFLNATGELMLAVSHDDATDESLFDFITIHPSNSESITEPTQALETQLEKAQPLEFQDCQVQVADQEQFPANMTFNPIIRDDEVAGIVIKITDITRQKRAQSRLKKAQGEAKEARKAREAQAAFLANMSHELRTPLNAIIGYSELVTEDAQQFGYDEVIPDLEKIQMAGQHLVALISDVLDMSKIEAGKVELEIDTFGGQELVDDVAAMMKPEIKNSGNQFVVDIDASLGSIRSDRTKLRQILSNLLNNAAKFTENGTIELAVSTYEQGHKPWICFEVRDTGIGIAEEKLPRLFEAFTQEDESTTRRYGGTGLGLAICKNFCDMLGGRIEVDTELGRGTSFCVHIPSLVSDRTLAQRGHSSQISATFQSDHSLSPDELDEHRTTLLIIDDDPSVHEMIARYLKDRSVHVVSALTGQNGLKKARQLRPDAIVVDVLMSTMSGWEVLSELKSDPATAQIPIVVGSILNEATKAYSLGADDYLVKPIDRDSLNSILERYDQESLRALVVEDDIHLRELLKRKIELERSHWDVDTVAHGGLAHQYLRERPLPDLILLDLLMPEVDGFDLLQIMHAHPQWRQIPVVVVTAMELSQHEEKLLHTHVRQILHKGPQGEDIFVDELTELLDHISPESPAEAIGTP